MQDINRIMVLSRTTKHCHKAVHYGISMARKFEAELYVVHSLHNPFGLDGWNIPLPSLPDLQEEYKRMQEEARHDIDVMIKAESAAGLPIEVIITEDEIVKRIIELVKEKKIDLLIMRAHQEWWLEHVFFGRGNEKLIRAMPCSILMIKDEPRAEIE